MAFKQSPFPILKGSKKHASALKGKWAQLGAATPNEDELPTAMKAHAAGHAEMDVNKWQYSSPTDMSSEGKDENKIFDEKGNHIGNWVNGKKVMKSTQTAHGQMDDAEIEFQQDMELAAKEGANEFTQERQPTFEGTDEYRSIDEIREDAERGKIDRGPVEQGTDPTYEGTDEFRNIDEIREDSERGKKKTKVGMPYKSKSSCKTCDGGKKKCTC